MKYVRPFAVLAFAASMTSSGFAQTAPATAPKPEEKPSVSVGAVLFTDFTYTQSPTATDADGNTYRPSSFNVARSYINVTGKMSRFSFRFTPDIVRETGTGSSLAGSLTFRVKYAFGQVGLDGVLPKGSFVRLGIQQTTYVDYMESIYRYRFQGTIFSDREGFTSSSDAGVSVRGFLPANYGDVHVGIYNGENYNRAEANGQKALQARVSIRPLPKAIPGLRVAGFVTSDHYVPGAERQRLIGAVTFEHKRVNAGFEYLQTKDQTSATKATVEADGYSVWATPKLGKGFEALLRYDQLEPDTATANRRERNIVGLAYWIPGLGSASSAVLLDYDRVTSTGQPTQEKIALHALVSF